MNEQKTYVEVQKFNQPWISVILYTVLIADFLVTFFFLLNNQIVFISFIPLLAVILIFVLFRVMKLSLSIDETTIRYRFFPFHLHEQVIDRRDVKQGAVVQYNPISDFGGWGIRYTFKKGKAFTIRGEFGLQLTLKNGKTLLIGTQDPQALNSFLTAYPLSSDVSENDTVKHFPDRLEFKD